MWIISCQNMKKKSTLILATPWLPPPPPHTFASHSWDSGIKGFDERRLQAQRLHHWACLNKTCKLQHVVQGSCWRNFLWWNDVDGRKRWRRPRGRLWWQLGGMWWIAGHLLLGSHTCGLWWIRTCRGKDVVHVSPDPWEESRGLGLRSGTWREILVETWWATVIAWVWCVRSPLCGRAGQIIQIRTCPSVWRWTPLIRCYRRELRIIIKSEWPLG